MNDLQLGWVAGIIEGEGCFIHQKERDHLRIQVKMTDEVVINRLQEITNVGRVRPADVKGKLEHHKDKWIWVVTKRDDTLWLAEKIMPLLSQRRRHRLQEILALMMKKPNQRFTTIEEVKKEK